MKEFGGSTSPSLSVVSYMANPYSLSHVRGLLERSQSRPDDDPSHCAGGAYDQSARSDTNLSILFSLSHVVVISARFGRLGLLVQCSQWLVVFVVSVARPSPEYDSRTRAIHHTGSCQMPLPQYFNRRPEQLSMRWFEMTCASSDHLPGNFPPNQKRFGHSRRCDKLAPVVFGASPFLYSIRQYAQVLHWVKNEEG